MKLGRGKGWTTAATTLFALVAFAANSLLCRAALAGPDIDPASFTMFRLASGALVLWILARGAGQGGASGGTWGSALALCTYALCFSLAYVRMDAGMGALLLFGAVQVSMFGFAIVSGERPGAARWAGLVIAVSGLVYLVSPGLRAPDPVSAGMMTLAGLAWGAYSLRAPAGEGALAATAGNFSRALPLALLAMPLFRDTWGLTLPGAVLACASGALASGLGYVAWYSALSGLRKTSASLVQLAVPVLAAAGGVLLLGEVLSQRLLLSAALTVGGIAIALLLRPGRN